MNHLCMSGRLVADPVLCAGPCGQRYASFELVVYDRDLPDGLVGRQAGRQAVPDRAIPCVLWGEAGVQFAYDGRAGQYVEVLGHLTTVDDQREGVQITYPLIRCWRADIIPAPLAGYRPWEPPPFR